VNDQAEIADRFRQDTTRHQMTILHDDGLYRHLRFIQAEGGEYWFDLITVPGALIFQGDGTTFAFRRTEDMFQLFRSGIYRDGSLHINPGYWSEKLTSDRDSVMTYSQKLFEEQVAEELRGAEADFPGVTKAWNKHVMDYNTEYEYPAREALEDFEFGDEYKVSCSECDEAETFSDPVKAHMWRIRHLGDMGDEHVSNVKKNNFYIDATGWNLQDFDWWFQWVCHAIVWGIARWDKVTRDGLRGLATPTKEKSR